MEWKPEDLIATTKFKCTDDKILTQSTQIKCIQLLWNALYNKYVLFGLRWLDGHQIIYQIYRNFFKMRFVKL